MATGAALFCLYAARIPGAPQHEVVRCRPGIAKNSSACDGPGSAVHHYVLHRARDTRPYNPK